MDSFSCIAAGLLGDERPECICNHLVTTFDDDNDHDNEASVIGMTTTESFSLAVARWLEKKSHCYETPVPYSSPRLGVTARNNFFSPAGAKVMEKRDRSLSLSMS
ncbi:MAG: hypothetical protein JXQ27_13405 [Acidobacteria bacterium]|nr:hypothetical protein [Acidobacteriota bacterium]